MTPFNELPEPERYTGHLIRRAQQVHAAIWQREVSTKVSSVQYATLAILQRHPGISQRDLGTKLSLDRSTIADIVSRMVRRGVVSREPSVDDRRKNVLYVTAQGETELIDLRSGVERVEHELTSVLSADDRGELRRILGLMLGSPTDTSEEGDALQE